MSPPDNPNDVVISSRPAVRIDGQSRPELEEALLDLVIEEAVNRVACCRAGFQNWEASSAERAGYRFYDRQILDFGHHIEILLDSQTLFSGHIVAIDGLYPAGAMPQIRVVAQDRLGKWQSVRQSRQFRDSSEADAIRAIAGVYGLQTDIQCDALNRIQSEIVQLNQTDLAFLAQRCLRVGAEFWVDGDLLFVYDRLARNGVSLGLTYGRELRTFEVQANLANQVTELSASGWSVLTKLPIEAKADRAVLGNEVSGKTGDRFLSEVAGERAQHLANEGPLDDQQARDLAEAAFRATARRFVTGTGVTATEPDLRAGTTLTLDGLGELFDGDYYTAGVHHHFNAEVGFETRFVVERADLSVADFDRPKRPPPTHRPRPNNPPAKAKPKAGAKAPSGDVKSVR